MNGSTPWRIALTAALTAGTLSTGQASDKASEPWADPEREPALLDDAQVSHLWDRGQEAFQEGTYPGQPWQVEEQARVMCVSDALQQGLPRAFRGGWNVEVRSGADARTATPGGRYIAVTPEDASHPQGVKAIAFILAHEMAHNVGRHTNRVASHMLAQEDGVEKTQERLEGLGVEGFEKVLLSAFRGRDSEQMSEQSVRHEYEADRGALHIMHEAGVPLDGGRGWAKQHKREAGTHDWEEITHPAPDVRTRAIDREASNLDRSGDNYRGDPTRQCEDSKLEKKGWMSKARDYLGWPSPNDVRADDEPAPTAAGSVSSEHGRRMTAPAAQSREAILKELAGVRERANHLREGMAATLPPRAGAGAAPVVSNALVGATAQAAMLFTPPEPRAESAPGQIQAVQRPGNEGMGR